MLLEDVATRRAEGSAIMQNVVAGVIASHMCDGIVMGRRPTAQPRAPARLGSRINQREQTWRTTEEPTCLCPA